MADANKKNTEKIVSLTKYVDGLKGTLLMKRIGDKHKDKDPEAYFNWLKLEIERATRKIDYLKGI